MPPEFNPHSIDATLATMLNEIKHIRDTVERVEEQTTKTNGRVSVLERWREGILIRATTVVSLLGTIGGLIAWGVEVGMDRLFSR